MKFCNVADPHRFAERVASLRGGVWFVDTQGQKRDFRPVAEQLRQLGGAIRLGEITGLELLLDDPNDRKQMVQYLMECYHR